MLEWMLASEAMSSSISLTIRSLSAMKLVTLERAACAWRWVAVSRRLTRETGEERGERGEGERGEGERVGGGEGERGEGRGGEGERGEGGGGEGERG